MPIAIRPPLVVILLAFCVLNFACARLHYHRTDLVRKRVRIERHVGKRVELLLSSGESHLGYLQSVSDEDVCLQFEVGSNACFPHSQIDRLRVLERESINRPSFTESVMVLAACVAIIWFLDSLPLEIRR